MLQNDWQKVENQDVEIALLGLLIEESFYKPLGGQKWVFVCQNATLLRFGALVGSSLCFMFVEIRSFRLKKH